MPEIRRRTWFFIGRSRDSRGRARLFETLITQQQLQKQLCTVLKVTASVFAGRVTRQRNVPRRAREEALPCVVVTIGIEFSRLRVPDGEKRILIARLNLNIAPRNILRYCRGAQRCTFPRPCQVFHPARFYRGTYFAYTILPRVNGTDIGEFFCTTCSPAFTTAGIIRQTQFCPSVSRRMFPSRQPDFVFRYRPRLGRLQCLHHRPDHRHDQDQGRARSRGA